MDNKIILIAFVSCVLFFFYVCFFTNIITKHQNQARDTYNICIIANTSMSSNDFKTIVSNFYNMESFTNFVIMNK